MALGLGLWSVWRGVCWSAQVVEEGGGCQGHRQAALSDQTGGTAEERSGYSPGR